MSYGGGLQAAPIAFPKAAGRARSPSKARSRTKAAPKARKKPPCKYGPRGADGYCPKKPRTTATATEKAVAAAIGVKAPRGSSRTSVAEKLAVKAGEKAAQKAAQKVAAKLEQRAKSKAGDVAVGAGSAAAGGLLKGKILTGGAKTIAARLGIAAAAGLAAYFLTKAIRDRIIAARDQKAAAKAALADAYRKTRLQVAAEAGRELTAAEHAELATAFRREAAKLGWTW